MNDHADRQRLLEALLFAAPAPLAEEELAQRLGEDADIPRLLRELAAQYAERGVNLVRLAGGWSFRTAPDLAPFLVSERPVSRKLSRAAVETLLPRLINKSRMNGGITSENNLICSYPRLFSTKFVRVIQSTPPKE